jgi:hypothetical protein
MSDEAKAEKWGLDATLPPDGAMPGYDLLPVATNGPHDTVWLRQRAEHVRLGGTYEMAKADRRSRDLVTLADALEGFFEHPNTTEDDKRLLNDALCRLLEMVR